MRFNWFHGFSLAALVLLLTCWIVPCAADTINVTITNDTNDSLCGGPLNLPCSLRDAILSANVRPGHDTIYLPPGHYILTIIGTGEDSSMTGDLDILDEVTIIGSGAATTFIDALGNDRVFECRADTQFFDVTIRGGDTSGGPMPQHGAGILVDQSTVSITRCAVEGNVTTTNIGGGVASTQGDLGIFDSVVRGNHASYGSGISTYDGSMLMIGSTVTENFGTLLSDTGGSIFSRDTISEIRNSTIANNHTLHPDTHAGVYFRGGSAGFYACTLADNDGDEIAVKSGYSAQVTLNNTIVKGDCSGLSLHSQGGNVGAPGIYCEFEPGRDYWGVPIYLHPLGDYGGPTPTMPLVYIQNDGNLAIDNGWADANCLPTDQRGVSRPQDGNGDGVAVCDSGAVEVLFEGPVFADGFESGDTSAWSVTVP